ncbi:hypothetical protein NUSPORA_02664 [Nucleospora cyclopteri]
MTNIYKKTIYFFKKLNDGKLNISNILSLIFLVVCCLIIFFIVYKGIKTLYKCILALYRISNRRKRLIGENTFDIEIEKELSEENSCSLRPDLYSKMSQTTSSLNNQSSIEDIISSNFERNNEIFQMIFQNNNKNIKIVKPTKPERIIDSKKDSSFSEEKLKEEIELNKQNYR